MTCCRFSTIALLFFWQFSVFAPLANAATTLDSIEQLQWQNRVIIVWNSSVQDIKQLKQASNSLSERDILWFATHDNVTKSNAKDNLSTTLTQMLKKTYPANKYKVYLIGKDGGTKVKSQELNLGELFNTIDQMPMRRAEMRGVF